ncbi:MAG: DUF748 domain-containing protein, partial [Planctomycetes bacterium]|nr:DUF748 domain-containing protein [Planctomycetota bacterium]
MIPISYGLDVNDVQWDPSDPNALQPAAQVHFWCKAPDVVDSLRLNGTITPTPPGIGFDLALVGHELNGQKLAPYLEPFGIEPLFAQAQLRATLKGQITPSPNGLETSFAVNEVLFSEPNRTWARVQSIEVRDMVKQGSVLTLGDVKLLKPILSVTRNANKAWEACGLRLLPRESRTDPMAIKPIVIPAQIKQLALTRGQLLWQDHSVQPAVDLSLHYDASLDQFTSNHPGESARFSVQLGIPSLLQSLQITGEANTQHSHFETDLKIRASGIDLTQLTPYFQGSFQPALINGEFNTSLQVMLDTNDTTQVAEVFLQNLILKEQGQITPLFRFDQATAKLVVTPENTMILNDISVGGLQALIQKTDTGSLEILGLAHAEPTCPVPAVVTERTPPAHVDTQDRQQTLSSQRLSLTHLPTVILKSLDLQIANLTFLDHSRPEAASIVAQDIRLHNTAPSRLISDALETAEPLHLGLSGSLVPLVDSFTISTKLAPFDPEPTLMVDLDVRGIHGEGLTAICPELETLIDGTQLKNGHLRSKLLAVMRLPRHTLLDFESNQAFELTLQMTDLTLSDENEPDLLAGLKEMHIELPVVNLARKDFQIKRLEMLEPQCSIQKTTQGLRVMNLLIRLPDANTPQDTNNTVVQAQAPSAPNERPLEDT